MYRTIIHSLQREPFAWLVFFVALFCSILLFEHGIVPQMQTRSNLESKIIALDSLAGTKGDYSAILKLVEDKKHALDTIVSSEISADSQNPELNGLLTFLIDRARDAGIQFVKMLPQESEQEKSDAIPIVLEMKVSYNALGQFVASLEKHPMLLQIDRIAILDAKSQDVSARILVTCFPGRRN